MESMSKKLRYLTERAETFKKRSKKIRIFGQGRFPTLDSPRYKNWFNLMNKLDNLEMKFCVELSGFKEKVCGKVLAGEFE